jgi:Flp pilus assembly protein TadD
MGAGDLVAARAALATQIKADSLERFYQTSSAIGEAALLSDSGINFAHVLPLSAQAMSAYPRIAEYTRLHGLLLYRAGRFNEALPVLQKAKELSGDDGAILFLLAMTHRNLGAENEAQSWLTQATKKRGEWTHARHGPSSSRASWGDVAKLNLLSREAEGVFALPIPEARGRR